MRVGFWPPVVHSSADGLVVMIERCQRLDPGSIPGRRTSKFIIVEISPTMSLQSRICLYAPGCQIDGSYINDLRPFGEL